MASQGKLRKKLLVCIILLCATILGYNVVIENLRWAKTLYSKKALLINGKIVDKSTSETSEGIYDNYHVEFRLGGLPVKKDSVTIWRNEKKPYTIGDSMVIIISTSEPLEVEAFENLSTLKWKIFFSITLIIISLYSAFEIIRLVSVLNRRSNVR